MMNAVEHPYQIIPAFTEVARTAAARIQVFHLEQLAILVGIIKQHVRNHMPDIFKLVTELWDNPALQLPLVSLVEAHDIRSATLKSLKGPFLTSDHHQLGFSHAPAS